MIGELSVPLLFRDMICVEGGVFMKKRNRYLFRLVVSASMAAASMVLNRFASIHTMGWTIGFAFVPIVLTAVLCGPFWAAAAGALADFVGAILFPFGPYFPGFTVCGAVMGLVYGLFLYRKNLRWWQVVLPALINNLILGLLVNTLWVSILYGSKTYWGWFVYRLPEYAVLVPLNLFFIPVLFRLGAILRRRTGL